MQWNGKAEWAEGGSLFPALGVQWAIEGHKKSAPAQAPSLGLSTKGLSMN